MQVALKFLMFISWTHILKESSKCNNCEFIKWNSPMDKSTSPSWTTPSREQPRLCGTSSLLSYSSWSTTATPYAIVIRNSSLPKALHNALLELLWFLSYGNLSWGTPGASLWQQRYQEYWYPYCNGEFVCNIIVPVFTMP